MKFQDDPDHCTQHQVEIERVKVQRISENSWIIFSRVHMMLSKHCDGEITKQPILGTYLATIDEPCDLEINGIRILHRILKESDAVEPIPLIALPQLRVKATISSKRVLNMNGVNLDEVKYMAYSLRHSEVIESVLGNNKGYNFSENLGFATLGLVTFSFLLFVFYVLRQKLLRFMCKKNYRHKSQIDPTDNFPLREGGVTETPHPSVLD